MPSCECCDKGLPSFFNLLNAQRFVEAIQCFTEALILATCCISFWLWSYSLPFYVGGTTVVIQGIQDRNPIWAFVLNDIAIALFALIIIGCQIAAKKYCLWTASVLSGSY